MPRRLALPALTLGGLLLLLAASADAAPPLTLRGCPPDEAAALTRLVTLELDSTAAALPGADALAIEIACVDMGVTLKATRPDGATLTRALGAEARQEPGGARLVSLVAAELVDALLAEPPRLPPEPTPDPTPEPEPPLAAPPAWRWAARLAASARLFTVDTSALLGPSAALGLWRDDGWGAELSGGVEWGSRTFETGETRVQLTSALLALGPRWGDASTLGVGAGLRAAWARLSAEPTGARTRAGRVDGLWGGPALTSAAQLRWRGLTARLDLEVGWSLWSVGGLVEGARRVQLDGLWLGAGLGVGWEGGP